MYSLRATIHEKSIIRLGSENKVDLIPIGFEVFTANLIGDAKLVVISLELRSEILARSRVLTVIIK